MTREIEDPEIRRAVIKDGIILGVGTLSIVSLFFLGRFIHAQLHGACNCLNGLLLEYGPSTLAILLAVGILLSVLRRRTSTRLRVQKELHVANRRMKGDLEAAAEIQRSLLPHSPPESPRIKFRWALKPCDELAGDTLNVFPLADHQTGLVYAGRERSRCVGRATLGDAPPCIIPETQRAFGGARGDRRKRGSPCAARRSCPTIEPAIPDAARKGPVLHSALWLVEY